MECEVPSCPREISSRMVSSLDLAVGASKRVVQMGLDRAMVEAATRNGERIQVTMRCATRYEQSAQLLEAKSTCP